MNDSFDFERFVVDQFARRGAGRTPPAHSVDDILTEASRIAAAAALARDHQGASHALPIEPRRRLADAPPHRGTLAVATILLLALAGAVVAGASLLPSPEVSTPVRNGLIAFASNGDIWVTDVDDTARPRSRPGRRGTAARPGRPVAIASPTGRSARLPRRSCSWSWAPMARTPPELRDSFVDRLGIDGWPPSGLESRRDAARVLRE